MSKLQRQVWFTEIQQSFVGKILEEQRHDVEVHTMRRCEAENDVDVSFHNRYSKWGSGNRLMMQWHAFSVVREGGHSLKKGSV